MLKKAFISIIFILLLVIIQGSSTSLCAQQDRQYTIKATWLYQFTKYIDWPEPYNDDEIFTIGIFDNDTNILPHLNELVEFKRAKNRMIKIKTFSSKITINANELAYCDMFFVSKENKELEESVLKIADFTNTLIVGESAKFAKRGGSISFYIQDNKIGIYINRDIIEAATYKIDPQLLRVARIIENESE